MLNYFVHVQAIAWCMHNLFTHYVCVSYLFASVNLFKNLMRQPDSLVGTDPGKKFHPRAQVRVENFTRGQQTGRKLHPRVISVTRLNIKVHQNIS